MWLWCADQGGLPGRVLLWRYYDVEMPVQPSDAIRAISEQAEPNRQRMHDQPPVGLIVGALAEIPGADGAEMGWSVLWLSVLLGGMADELTGGLEARQFAAQAMAGFEIGGLIGSAVGSELIARDDLRGDGRLAMPAELAERRPGVVANAATAVREGMRSAAFAEDVLNNAADRGRWAGEGMVSTLTGELPGLDLTQAGTALLACGGHLLSTSAEIGADTVTHGLFRTRRKVAEAMPFVGTALAGAIMALVADACLTRASPTA
jgi:hypothetical protein